MLTDAYLRQLQALMPPGAAWSREADATTTGLLTAWADELARVDGRATDVIDESDHLTTNELLLDWERAAGLPDACVPVTGSIRERQIAIARKVAGLGGQTSAFYVDLAARLGLEVEIIEHGTFAVGSLAGERCSDDSWRHVWEVHALAATASSDLYDRVRFTAFAAGSTAGERLRNLGAEDLECVIERAKPAHTIVMFTYEIDAEPLLWFDFLTD